jgi:opacity protein-like surface antigen
MKKVFLLASLVFLFALQGYTQDTPKMEIFGGYSYIRITSASAGIPSYTGLSPLDSSGWEASANWNLNHWFGLKADFDGNYCCKGQYIYSFLGGPQLSLRKDKYTVFVHGLLGGAYAQGLYTTDTNLAWALGGGVDWNVNRMLAIRLPQVDYFGTRFLGGTQNDLRVSGGLVFRFGKK